MVKARVQKRLYYKIGEACKTLGIQPYVLRYWETEFPALAPSKSRSGQRVYSEKELEIIRRIKELLYDEGYTIAGAKKKLEVELTSGTLGEVAEAETAAEETEAPEDGAPEAPPVREEPPPLPLFAEASAGEALDTDAAERIQKLRSGIGKALEEAREILALLSPHSR
ncbi:MAG TPA: MerR family transcriptional regulator [Thermoanaerobaculia bacterium]|nr:MerR family transcriptional regulator [Thermoanaerobaculia bacterium]